MLFEEQPTHSIYPLFKVCLHLWNAVCSMFYVYCTQFVYLQKSQWLIVFPLWIVYSGRRGLPASPAGCTGLFLSRCSSWHNWVLNIRSCLSSQVFSDLHHHIQRWFLWPSWLSTRDSYNPWECCDTWSKDSSGIEGRTVCIISRSFLAVVTWPVNVSKDNSYQVSKLDRNVRI